MIRDKRRIDPTSGEVRPEAAAPPAAAAPAGAGGPQGTSAPVAPQEVVALQDQLAERTLDLQRLKAEFDNYRRRVERDRALAGEQATARVLTGLLSILDDLGRARDHGDLTGPFKAVSDQLESTLSALGLVGFGEPGDEFDPTRHEALLHAYRDDVPTATCVDVMRRGYEYAGRVLRAAQVAVAEPRDDSDRDDGYAVARSAAEGRAADPVDAPEAPRE